MPRRRRTLYSISFLLGVAALVGALASPASAASVTYYFDSTNDTSLTNGPWGEVFLDDSSGDVRFSVDAYEEKLVAGPNFGIQAFYFNYKNVTLTTENITDLPAGWTFSLGSYEAGGSFGRFEVISSGTGGTRADPLRFSISGIAGDTIWNYVEENGENHDRYCFAAKIAGYGPDGEGSGKFAALPLPGSMLLLASGLAGFGFLKRRKP